MKVSDIIKEIEVAGKRLPTIHATCINGHDEKGEPIHKFYIYQTFMREECIGIESEMKPDVAEKLNKSGARVLARMCINAIEQYHEDEQSRVVSEDTSI